MTCIETFHSNNKHQVINISTTVFGILAFGLPLITFAVDTQWT